MKTLFICLLGLLFCFKVNSETIYSIIPIIDTNNVLYAKYLKAIANTNGNQTPIVVVTNILPLGWSYTTNPVTCFIGVLQTIDFTNYQFAYRLPYGTTNFTIKNSTRNKNFYLIGLFNSETNSLTIQQPTNN